jgi:hypothetical protein
MENNEDQDAGKTERTAFGNENKHCRKQSLVSGTCYWFWTG